VASDYLGNEPVGVWGPLEIADGGLARLTEFLLPPETYTITLEPLTAADLALAVHVEGTAYQPRGSQVVGSQDGGPGEEESVTFAVTTGAYHCLTVFRTDHGTAPAPYRLHIIDSVTPVADQAPPRLTAVTGAWPNPFNPRTTVAFTLARDDHARLTLFDLQGRAVRHLVDAQLPAGRHTAVWQGCDDRGRRLASGVYFARLQASSGQGMVKVVMVK